MPEIERFGPSEWFYDPLKWRVLYFSDTLLVLGLLAGALTAEAALYLFGKKKS